MLPVSLILVALAPSAPGSRCDVRVYVADADPGGLNVRARPSARTGEVVARLPTTATATILHVDRAAHGWLHFDAVEVISDSPEGGAPGGAARPSEGWVHGGLLAVDLQPSFGETPATVIWPRLWSRASGAAEPAKTPRRGAQVERASQGDDRGRVTRPAEGHALAEGDKVEALLDCDGTSVLVRVRTVAGAKRTGWLRRGDYCGNPLTSCP